MTENNKTQLCVEIRGGDKVHLKNALKDGLGGNIIKIDETAIRYEPNQPVQYFITVKDKELPLDVIHRGHPLIRDGHKISLINKRLILRP